MLRASPHDGRNIVNVSVMSPFSAANFPLITSHLTQRNCAPRLLRREAKALTPPYVGDCGPVTGLIASETSKSSRDGTFLTKK